MPDAKAELLLDRALKQNEEGKTRVPPTSARFASNTKDPTPVEPCTAEAGHKAASNATRALGTAPHTRPVRFQQHKLNGV
jgi:hypothetical protein